MAGMMRGAFASPRHKLASAVPHVAEPCPPQWASLAPKLSYWGNATDGDCVSAEEASAKATTVFIPEDTIVSWARRHGWLNGASLTEVMDAMISEGIAVGGVTYKDGPYQSVNWTDYPTLCSAIYQGQVKIGIAADAVMAAATPGKNGWVLLAARHDQNIDHSTGYAGYGSLAFCCQQLGVSVPAGVDPETPCLIMFTWNSYGIVSQAVNVAITGEAWLRSPTTVTGDQPNPAPSPTPSPQPPAPQPTPTRRGQELALALTHWHETHPDETLALLDELESHPTFRRAVASYAGESP